MLLAYLGGLSDFALMILRHCYPMASGTYVGVQLSDLCPHKCPSVFQIGCVDNYYSGLWRESGPSIMEFVPKTFFRRHP
jgi:hypothetical protein